METITNIKTTFSGARIRSIKPYLKQIKNASHIIISDFCPNPAFTTPEQFGWKEVDKNFDFTGHTVWYRRATSMGKSRVYIKFKF